jgi:hypothetical protein
VLQDNRQSVCDLAINLGRNSLHDRLFHFLTHDEVAFLK